MKTKKVTSSEKIRGILGALAIMSSAVICYITNFNAIITIVSIIGAMVICSILVKERRK